MTRRFEVSIVIVSAVVIALIAYGDGSTRKQPPSVYSTYDTGRNGYRALYEVLHSAGVPVGRFERVLGTLDPSVKTLIITGNENDPGAHPLDEHDAARLRRFVQNGGRLVAIDEEFAGPQDVTPGVGATLRNGGGEAIALARNPYMKASGTCAERSRGSFPSPYRAAFRWSPTAKGWLVSRTASVAVRWLR